MRIRFLVSYHYYAKADLGAFLEKLGGRDRVALFADSGAYSARSQGAEIKLDEYAAWVRRWQDCFEVYANLDVIGSAEETLVNQKRLEDMGLRPLPVFHAGESRDFLEGYLSTYNYVGLGGMVKAPKEVNAWLVRCFKLAEGRAVYHGFGMTRWAIIQDFPFYSVDSSSWGSGHRFGVIRLFDRGRWITTKVGTPEVYRYGRLIREHGGEPEKFADRSKYHRTDMARMSAAAWYRAADWLKERHGPIALPSDPSRIGPLVYLASAKADNNTVDNVMVPAAEAGLHVYLADGSLDNLACAAEAGPHVYLALDGHTRPSSDSFAAVSVEER